MSREIKFRGKRIDNGKWVFGDLSTGQYPSITWCERIPDVDGESSYELDCADVDPETVGQYTGLDDWEGNVIYEGDVLEANEDEDITKGIVFFEDGKYKVTSDWTNIRDYSVYDALDSDLIKDNEMRVIGNIYETPELLHDPN